MKNSTIVNLFAVLLFFALFFSVGKLYAFLLLAGFLLLRLLPMLLMLVGNMKYAKGEIEKSKRYFHLVYKCPYASMKQRIIYSYILLSDKKLDEASKILISLSGKTMSTADRQSLLLNQSLVAWKKDKLDEAIMLMKQAYQIGKTMVVYQNLGYFLILKGDYEKALEFNLEAYEYDESNAGILDNLGESYYFLEEYHKALRLLQSAVQKKPTYPSPYYYLALTLLKLGRLTDAAAVLKQALDCRFSYLSAVQKAEVEGKLAEIESINNSIDK